MRAAIYARTACVTQRSNSALAVERRIQGSLRNLKSITRDLPDAEQHAVSMERFQRHRFEDQHVQCAWQQVGSFAHEIRLLAHLGV